MENNYFGATDDSEVTWPGTADLSRIFSYPFDWSMLEMLAQAGDWG